MAERVDLLEAALRQVIAIVDDPYHHYLTVGDACARVAREALDDWDEERPEAITAKSQEALRRKAREILGARTT